MTDGVLPTGLDQVNRILEIYRERLNQAIAVPAEMLNGNEEVKKMATATEPRIVLETGNVRVGTQMSSRTFFVYVSPTGAEMPLGQCPVMKREYSQSHGRFGTPDFAQTSAYILRGEGRLKMICLSSSFGKPRKVVNLFIDIGPDLEVIEVSGVGECGKFSGRGRLDFEDSLIQENRVAVPITQDLLRKEFGYRILQGGTKKVKKGVRSIIF